MTILNINNLQLDDLIPTNKIFMKKCRSSLINGNHYRIPKVLERFSKVKIITFEIIAICTCINFYYKITKQQNEFQHLKLNII